MESIHIKHLPQLVPALVIFWMSEVDLAPFSSAVRISFSVTILQIQTNRLLMPELNLSATFRKQICSQQTILSLGKHQ